MPLLANSIYVCVLTLNSDMSASNHNVKSFLMNCPSHLQIKQVVCSGVFLSRGHS